MDIVSVIFRGFIPVFFETLIIPSSVVEEGAVHKYCRSPASISASISSQVVPSSIENSKEAILNIEKEQARDYYLIQIYHCSTAKQIENIDLYLKNTFLPYLHKNGIEKVGVFAPLNNDTASDKKLYVWVPFKNIQKLDKLDQYLR